MFIDCKVLIKLLSYCNEEVRRRKFVANAMDILKPTAKAKFQIVFLLKSIP